MSEHDDQNRTEDPTPRRREDARREGRVVFSADLTLGLMLLLGGLLIPMVMQRSAGLFTSLIHEAGTFSRTSHWDADTTRQMFVWLLSRSLLFAGPVCIGAWLFAVGSAQIQIGSFAWTEMKIDWSRLWNPSSIARVFSTEQLVNGLLSMLKALTVLGIAFVVIWVHRSTVADGAATSASFLSQLVLSIGGGVLAWGVVDYAIKWQRHEAKLKMTKEEIKRESREDTGDPQIRMRRRQLHREAMKQRTLKDVPKATLVVKNPTHFAIALKYTPGQPGAPTVIAKGKDVFARAIIKKAEEHGVPVLERKPLARALYQLVEVGQMIPAELFQAVAEVLVFVYRKRNLARREAA
ncbi:MAG: EscU/YscU/HrcU family type III secretion system export apparatus switch protein [Planctomycetaceae bacterium]|nr:EscU/YscU/HrcU family type III secretion system export apparatus switch protein [Planctomycetaceae bacterium]MCA9029460.1 EscU/YscU/HrcU family type III secretion system export apparatus switch protein [Planctomycetaceae bacterium]MCA9042785.1 EscU/YscU/HrcU family type III secretion system export apparatus switch protein [Planctomycetaceae bacterium]MCB9952607.1 EscU/YscU/HrcU family type III secretion system export apparatus switch protein [Planctomycetaceae bacterium]